MGWGSFPQGHPELVILNFACRAGLEFRRYLLSDFSTDWKWAAGVAATESSSRCRGSVSDTFDLLVNRITRTTMIAI